MATTDNAKVADSLEAVAQDFKKKWTSWPADSEKPQKAADYPKELIEDVVMYGEIPSCV